MSEGYESRCLNPTTRSFDSPELGINSFSPESHVAQQRRRDKLRIPVSSTRANYPQNFFNHLGQLSSDSGANTDLSQVRSLTNCDATMFSSEMLNFSMNTHVLLASKDGVLHPESDSDQSGRSVGSEYAAFPNSSQAVPSNFTPSAKASVPQDPCFWKGISSQHSADWIVNYVNVSGGNNCGQNPLFVGEVFPGIVREANLSVSSLYSKHGGNGYQDVQSSLTNHGRGISTQDGQKHYGETNVASSPFYQNALQEVVTSSTVGSQGFEIASLVQQNIRPTSLASWMDGGNELVLRPTYGDEANASRLNDSVDVIHSKAMDTTHQWNGELDFLTNRCGRGFETVARGYTAGGLSLSLSSHQPSDIDMTSLGQRIGSQNLQSDDFCNGSEDSKTNYAGYICSNTKLPTASKDCGNSLQGIVVSSTCPPRNMGPLGPFTGYATILKNSKYLKPAQQLLDEFCSMTGPRVAQTFAMSERGSREVSISSDPMNAEIEIGVIGGGSGFSSSPFNSSSEACGEGQVGTGSWQSYRPDFQQRKAKLLYMKEEVCRRYKQYHQQMQMVVSSFESVEGLSSATPYTSLALKTVSRHFRCLKSAISDQLRRITKVLGEDLLSHACATYSCEGDMAMPKLKFIDQSLRKQKSGGDRLGFLEPQQHVWRPQRGLPERAVAVLRAWLFDHFLHPYPTDTDKHMLASQTGLSRNQVSNWFINARVRVWKPMVEEMHMLETKSSADMSIDSSNCNAKPNGSGSGGHLSNQPNTSPECTTAADPLSSAAAVRSSDQWSQEKRSRMDCHLPTDANLGLMGIVPHHQSGLEIGGLEAVSLTLGLRHNTDGADQQQHQEHQLRRHYGGHMFQDFVG